MKKLSVFFSILTIFCFLTAGSAVAQTNSPKCGVYLLSLGTSFNTLSTSFTTIPGMCQSANDICTMWDGGIAWNIATCPDSCQQRTTMLPNVVTFYNVKGGAAVPALEVAQKYKQEKSTGLGTLTFADWRLVPGPPNPIPRWHCKVTKSNSDLSLYFTNYTSAQTGACDVDFAAVPTTNFPADSKWTNQVEAEIISGDLGGAPLPLPTDYTRVLFRYEGRSGSGLPTPLGSPPTAYVVAAPVGKVSVEITKPRRGDLDGDNSMTLNDFSIFKADYNAGPPLCACPLYWY
mgnify:CR=1 FL=1